METILPHSFGMTYFSWLTCCPKELGQQQPAQEADMTLEELRKQIDVLDRELVVLLSKRAEAALEAGRLKVSTELPIYEPAREKLIYENVRKANAGPLPDIELTHIFERIIDVMRLSSEK